MRRSADVVVVGAGPAGSATAIWAAAAGLRVVAIERAAFPRFRPGETLHPGVKSVLGQLGVADDVEAASAIRPDGQVVAWGHAPRHVAYGRDAQGPWHGYQIARERLDAILLGRAATVGVDILQPVRHVRPLMHDNKVIGVETEAGALTAAVVIDATGACGWLHRILRTGLEVRSPRLLAFYGYVRGAGDATPRMEGSAAGWTWTAQVEPDLAHWCRLDFSWTGRRPAAPHTMQMRDAVGIVRSADVTWRRAACAAGPGYFLAGDAAFILDPAASHGVLRAIMSGMQAGQCAIDTIRHGADAAATAARYDQWIAAWFAHDTTRLAGLYGQLNRSWNAETQEKRAEAVQV